MISTAARLEGERQERTLASPRFRDGTFHNTRPLKGTLKPGAGLSVASEWLLGKQARTPPAPLPVFDPRPHWQKAVETGLRVTWLGHSAVLLELDGVRVLTDPVFGLRASPSKLAGPKRFHAPPAEVAALPELDAVLVSHDHYDHLCAETIRLLAARSVPFVTALGVGRHLQALGVPPERIFELDWWETKTLPGADLSFTAAPARHFSGRGVVDRNRTLWASWVMASSKRKVFFSGDTGLTDEYVEVGRRLGPFDLVMLEVGAFHESWGDIHLGPKNALAAHEMLGSGALLPVHWGTFNLALHAWDEPAETLVSLAQEKRVRLLTPKLGLPFEPARTEGVDPWWRQVR